MENSILVRYVEEALKNNLPDVKVKLWKQEEDVVGIDIISDNYGNMSILDRIRFILSILERKDYFDDKLLIVHPLSSIEYEQHTT